jgi:hypothetical protein
VSTLSKKKEDHGFFSRDLGFQIALYLAQKKKKKPLGSRVVPIVVYLIQFGCYKLPKAYSEAGERTCCFDPPIWMD